MYRVFVSVNQITARAHFYTLLLTLFHFCRYYEAWPIRHLRPHKAHAQNGL